MGLNKHEFTNAGRSMLGRAQNGETLTVSSIVVGSGSAGQPSDLWPLTALIQHEVNVIISSKRDYGNGVMLVEGNFRSDHAPHPFDLREVGVMAHVAAEADRLYSVANVFTDVPVHIDPAAPVITAFKIKLIIERIPSDDIIVQIGPSEAVTGENIGSDTIGPGFYKESIGNLQRFKRAHAGAGIRIEEDEAEEVITFSTRSLTTNVDLYVPENYASPPPGTLPEQFFHTIQDAHNYLLQFLIPADKMATINVDAGHWTQTTPIVFTHPDAARIRVIGRPISTKTMTGSITRAGAQPNLDITVHLSNSTGIAVNDVVYLYDAPDSRMEGCGYVTSVVGTTVVIRMRIENSLPPSTIGAGSAKLLVFPTQFVANMASDAIFKSDNGILNVKNFGFRSTQAQKASAIYLFGKYGGIENCIAVNFSTGFAIGAAEVLLTPLVAANACSVGMQVGPSGNVFMQAPNPTGGWNRFSWNGNLVYGLWVVGGSYITRVQGSATFALCNGTCGVEVDSRGWAGHSNEAKVMTGWIVGYNDIGARAGLAGIFQAAVNVQSQVAGNISWDLAAGSGGQIYLVRNIIKTGLYSPPLDELGPSGGYIAIGKLNGDP